MSKLSLLGGEPIIKQPFNTYQSIGAKEKDAVLQVLNSGCLSGFYADYGENFLGGPKVQEFEHAWADRFKVKYAISVNSNTSGLYAAMGAIGLSPGDEVIVPPYSMSATVVAPLAYGAVPVFADIEDQYFGLDPARVKELINNNTKAIIVTNLWGHAANLHALFQIAVENNLYLIEDNAQSPLATENSVLCGTIGHIGVFSLNYHKHIHTGEGGVCVTNDPELAVKLQMIRNHAESIVEDANIQDLSNMYGGNYRLSELHAAIGLVQLNDIDMHVGKREEIALELSEVVKSIPGLTAPVVKKNCRHVYYVWGLKVNSNKLGISRATLSKALAMEGFPHGLGYIKPLYLLPLFQQKIAMGRDGFPFNNSNVNYLPGMCQVVEKMYSEQIIVFEVCSIEYQKENIQLLCDALRKVIINLDILKKWEAKSNSRNLTCDMI